MSNVPDIAAYAALVVALVQAVKIAAGGKLPVQFLPLIAIALGLALGVYDHLKLVPSLMIGISAMVLYSGGKTVINH